MKCVIGCKLPLYVSEITTRTEADLEYHKRMLHRVHPIAATLHVRAFGSGWLMPMRLSMRENIFRILDNFALDRITRRAV